MALYTSQMRTEWAEYLCNTKDWHEIELLNRSPVKIIAKLAEAWSAFERVMYFYDYGDASIVGSYACRNISSSGLPSMHSYRLACDIDPQQNWLQGNGVTMNWDRAKVTKQQVHAVERIRTNTAAQVFRNGWVFSNPDPMHFQLSCKQSDIESGIDWSTVDDIDNAPSPPVEAEPMITPGYPVTHVVEDIQNRLLFWDAAALPRFGADGDYGSETSDWVGRFQTANSITTTGNVDGLTYSLLQEYDPDSIGVIPDIDVATEMIEVVKSVTVTGI